MTEPPSRPEARRRFGPHLIGAHQERLRDCQPERLGGCKIDDEIELGRLLDRNFAGLRPAKNLVDIIGGASEQVRDVWSVGHQTSHFDVLTEIVNRRQSRGERQGVDSDPVGDYERVTNNIECVRATFEPQPDGW
jgi:hypothetical protein